MYFALSVARTISGMSGHSGRFKAERQTAVVAQEQNAGRDELRICAITHKYRKVEGTLWNATAFLETGGAA